MRDTNWPEWRSSCRELAKMNARNGFIHAAAALDIISSTRVTYDDVPLSCMRLGMLECVRDVLDELEAHSVKIYRAQMVHWFDVEKRAEGARVTLEEANRLARRGELRHWMRRAAGHPRP